jgi:hypothetical protein
MPDCSLLFRLKDEALSTWLRLVHVLACATSTAAFSRRVVFALGAVATGFGIHTFFAAGYVAVGILCAASLLTLLRTFCIAATEFGLW